MAKDDYHVVVYQILAYLYVKLKAGEAVDVAMLKHDSKIINVNERYWTYIMVNMIEQGYIKGSAIEKAWGNNVIILYLEESMITPQGIEYLCDNSFMKKAKSFLKDIKEITPFI